MTLVRKGRRAGGLRAPLPACVALGLCLAAAGAGGDPGKAPVPAAEPAWTQTHDPPEVRDTPANLQAMFGNEMNARETYLAYGTQAEAEGFPAIGRIFRALARAESIHARRTVQAIALTGQPARAVMERIELGMTSTNLERAISGERYEAEVLYPAYLERAKADRQPAAVRALTLAMATERQHVRLLEQGLAHLEERPVAATIYVCPGCGRTTEVIEHRKCPGCYTSASRFLRPA
jgi:rubrerythrin